MNRFCKGLWPFLCLFLILSSIHAVEEQKKRIKLVILDNSGTSNDCGVYAPATVVVKLFEKYGVSITMEEARKPMGLFKKDHIRAILNLDRVSDKFKRVFGREWGEADVENMYAEFVPMLMSCLEQYSELIPGTAATIEKIRKEYGVIIGLTTGFNQEMNELLLRKASEQGYCPDVFTSASQVEKGRPYWYMVEENMRQAGISDPEEVLKIGDTAGDMQEGKAMKAVASSGTWTLGLAATGNCVGRNWKELTETPGDCLQNELITAESFLYEAGADYVAPNINSLPTIINLINKRLEKGDKPRDISLEFLHSN